MQNKVMQNSGRDLSVSSRSMREHYTVRVDAGYRDSYRQKLDHPIRKSIRAAKSPEPQ
jgi:hypothetical protein